MSSIRVIDDELGTHRWMREHLGEGHVYPGHPLVLASIIMASFDTFEAADAPTGHGWCVALSDSRVPGAGDHVGAAIRVLRHGKLAGASVDEMVAEANRYWEDGRAGGHEKSVEPGRAQSLKIEPFFRANVRDWLDGQLVAAG